MDDWDDWDDPGFDEDADLSDVLDEEEDDAHGDWALDDDDDFDEDLDGFDDGGDGLDAAGAGGLGAEDGGWVAASATAGPEGAGRMGMSAWEFGTATAVAGWLLDRQADRIVEAVRASASATAAAQDPGTSLPPAEPVEPWQRLPAPPLDPSADPLTVGEPLEASRLHTTLSRWLAAGQDRVLEAQDADGVHRLAVLVSPLVPARPVWIVAEEAAGGFTGTRLLPLFSDGEGGRWVCAVSAARPAVAVVTWALERHGLAFPDLRCRP